MMKHHVCGDVSRVQSLGSPTAPYMIRVRRLVLRNKHLGYVTSDLFLSPHLRILDLSSKFFNGVLPHSVFNATELQTISFGIKNLSGQLPQIINIFISPGSESANAFTGESSILNGASLHKSFILVILSLQRLLENQQPKDHCLSER